VEIDLVGHEGGTAIGEHAYTLTVTDIATGWIENREWHDLGDLLQRRDDPLSGLVRHQPGASFSSPKVQVTKRCTDTIVACPSRPSSSAAVATPSSEKSVQVFVGGTCQAVASSVSKAYAAMTAVTVSQPSRLIQLTSVGARLPLRPKGTRDSPSVGAPPHLSATP
jgi:hypothetical protein